MIKQAILAAALTAVVPFSTAFAAEQNQLTHQDQLRYETRTQVRTQTQSANDQDSSGTMNRYQERIRNMFTVEQSSGKGSMMQQRSSNMYGMNGVGSSRGGMGSGNGGGKGH